MKGLDNADILPQDALMTIEERRTALGMSRTQFAAACDISERTVWAWEREGSVPNYASRKRAATVLGLEPSQIAWHAYAPKLEAGATNG